MEELLNKLLESELLTPETRDQLAESFKTHIASFEAEARADIEVQVRAELIEKYNADFEKLVEAVDTKVEDGLSKELAELKEDIEKFRDLEVEYTERLVEARHEMAETVKVDMAQLIETLDTFLEARLEAEFVELKESIEDVKKNNIGMRLFESFSGLVKENFLAEDDTAKELVEAKKELDAAKARLDESSKEVTELKRSQKLNSLLESLTGLSLEVMTTLLSKTPYEKLEEAYEQFIPRVLHETARVGVPEKESVATHVLAENVDPTEKTVVVSGDSATVVVTESVTNDALEAQRARLKALAMA